MVVPALIGAAGGLLGGIFGRKKEKSADQNSYDAIMGQARGSREASEKYGFNPLTLLGASSAVGPSESSNYMGNAIANSAMLLADGLAKREEKFGQLAAMQKQNEELKLQVRELTLRPKFGGIYAQRQAVPTLGAALGVQGASSARPDRVVNSAAAGGAAGADADKLRPLVTTHPLDARREVENDPMKTTGGFMTIDNPNMPFSIYAPTLDGDEAVQWYDLPSVALYGAASAFPYARQKGQEFGRWLRASGTQAAHDAAWRAHDKDRMDRLMQSIGSKPRSRTTDYERQHRSRRWSK